MPRPGSGILCLPAAIAGPSASSSVSTSASVASGSAASSSSTGITSAADLFRLSTLPMGTSLWTVTSAVAPMLMFKQLATEASVEAKDIEVAGCVSCLEVVSVKVDDLQQGRGWAHSCTGDRADLDVGDGRDNCWSIRVYIASDLHKFPALRQAVGNVVEEHSLADVLKSIKAGPLHAYADLIPPAYTPSDQDPPVLVLPNSSAAWLAFNAIALTHSLTPGAHAELESGRNPSVRAMSGIVGAVSKAGGTSTCSSVRTKCATISSSITRPLKGHAPTRVDSLVVLTTMRRACACTSRGPMVTSSRRRSASRYSPGSSSTTRTLWTRRATSFPGTAQRAQRQAAAEAEEAVAEEGEQAGGAGEPGEEAEEVDEARWRRGRCNSSRPPRGLLRRRQTSPPSAKGQHGTRAQRRRECGSDVADSTQHA